MLATALVVVAGAHSVPFQASTCPVVGAVDATGRLWIFTTVALDTVPLKSPPVAGNCATATVPEICGNA